MPCRRSTACAVSQMEASLSVPGDGHRSLTNGRMRFRLSTLLIAVGVTALFTWMHIRSYTSPKPSFASMNATQSSSSVPGYGWPFQCIDVVSTIIDPIQHSTTEHGEDLYSVGITNAYHVRPWHLVANFVALCLAVVMTTRLAVYLQRK